MCIAESILLVVFLPQWALQAVDVWGIRIVVECSIVGKSCHVLYYCRNGV